MEIPRIVIAGTHSGCGKTTIAAGIMSVLTRRGFKVQPYKVGPDYIDPMFHRFVTGRHSRNLDAWLLDPETLKGLFLKSAVDADIAVIEGVMGFYDGLGGTSFEASTAHVAGIIKSPVVLVVNAAGISLSIAAMIKGYREFVPENGIGAVILNNIKNEGHYSLLKKVIEEHNGIKVTGYLPPMKELSLPSRHLGLVPLEELGDLREKMEILATTMGNTIDFDNLLTMARQAPDLQSDFKMPEQKKPPVKIGIARDKAFNFYYQDNLDLLEQLGAELILFSPLESPSLPADICGLYLGGGYPEVFAHPLYHNLAMRMDIKAKIEDGMPTYAECGGMMYLGEAIIDSEGDHYEMCGVFPATTQMTTALQRFGYVSVTVTKDNLLGKTGDTIHAHEFHYSTMQFKSQSMEGDYCCRVSKKKPGSGESVWQDGLKYKNTLAGYAHLHFWSDSRFAGRFIQKCLEYQGSKQ